MKRLKEILIVDDDDISNIIAEELFKSLALSTRYKILRNGQEAFDYILEVCNSDFKRDCPELIFVDLHMPVMDGQEFVTALKKLNNPNLSDLKIIAISASSFEKNHDHYQQIGFTDFIHKPLTEEKIQAVVEKHIASSSSID